MCITGKLMEHPEFTGAMFQIRHVGFVAREESGRNVLKAEVDSDSYEPNANDSRSSHTTSLNYALFVFATMDHASLLGLGHLDMESMRQLCVLEEVDDIPDGMQIDGVGDSGSGEGDGGDGYGNDGDVVAGSDNGGGGDDGDVGAVAGSDVGGVGSFNS